MLDQVDPPLDPDCVAQMRNMLGAAAYEGVFRAPEEANGLPNSAYNAADWLALEYERLFRRGWVFVCAEAEIPNVGDIKPAEICAIPVFAVHSGKDRLQVFQNVCRHRGAQLIDAACRKNNITCPYHSWTYGLDGKLKVQPHFHGANQHGKFTHGGGDRFDLLEIRSARLFGCLFANFSGDAPAIEDAFAPVLNALTEYDLSVLRWAGKRDFIVEANWKLAFENYVENYHVFSLHPRLTEFVPMDLRMAGGWTGTTFENGYNFPAMEPGRGEGMPHYPNLSKEKQHRGSWFMTLPNFSVEVYPDQFTIIVGHPDGPTRTREEMHIFLIGDEAATGARYKQGREDVFKMWEDLNREDLGVLERLQKGRQCPGYDGGRISPHWEKPTLEFCQKILLSMARP